MSEPLPDSFIFSAAWAALTERIAIIEADGDLDHRAAILAATRAQLPSDFAETTRLAKEKGLDPETAIYDFIEELMREEKKARKGAIAGHGEAQTGEGVQTHYQDRETPILRGIEALQCFTDRGYKLIGRYEGGAAIASGDDYNKAFTADIAIIKALMAGAGDTEGRAKGKGIQRFDFRPADYGFLCLDIDCKDGKNGIADLYGLFAAWGKSRDTLPATLRDIPGSFPCYVYTPSSGIHLYFRYQGTKDIGGTFTKEIKSVEIKTGGRTITIPGSRKPGGEYVLHGSLDKAPELYPFIMDHLPLPQQEPPRKFIPLGTDRKKFDGLTTWEKVIEFTDQDGQGGEGRAALAYSIALHAKTHKWNYDDTLTAMRNEPRLYGLEPDRLLSAVNSAYQKRGA